MRTLLILLVMTMSSVSYAQGFKAKLAGTFLGATKTLPKYVSSVEIKKSLAEGLYAVKQTNYQIKTHFNGGVISKSLPVREVGDAKVKTVIGYYKDDNVKKYFIELNMAGYSHHEVTMLQNLIEEKTGLIVTLGRRMDGKYPSYLQFSPLKGVKDASKLDERLEVISDAISTFYKVTDPKKDMINEVVQTHRTIYTPYPEGSR